MDKTPNDKTGAPRDGLTDLFHAAYEASRRYMEGLDDRSVMPDSAAIDALGKLHEPLPFSSTDPMTVFEQLDQVGSPATVATTGRRFFGFVVGGALPISIASSWLATTWDQNAGSWLLSPIAGELEVIAGRWMLELLDLPRDAAFGFVTGATMATYSSLAAARSSLLRKQAPELRIIYWWGDILTAKAHTRLREGFPLACMNDVVCCQNKARWISS